MGGCAFIVYDYINMKKHITFISTLVSALLFTSLSYADLNLELPDLNLPDLGGQANVSFNSASEREHGLAILRRLRSSGQIIEDPELNTWIRSLGNQLTSNAPQSATPFYFVIARDTSVNAFATIGGVVVVNAGLILRSDSESELAAVMAHEIAHITQRHIIRMIRKAEGSKFATGAAILAGIIASSKSAEAGSAIINATLAASAHRQLSFSRDAESEADRVGLRILARSGFDPKGMPSFLAKLELFSDGQNANAREYLRSHPLTLKRVSDLRTRAKRIRFNGRKQSSNYFYMREKVRALSRSTKPVPDKVPANVKKYAKALQLSQRNNNRLALQTIGSKSRTVPETILIGKLLNKERRYKESIVLLKPLLDIYLGNEALSVLLSEAYISVGQRDNAWRTLKAINVSEQTSLELFEVKQRIARNTRHDGEAYRAAAERNIRMGNYKAAISLLRQAIKSPSSDANQLLQLQSLLSRIERK